MELEAVTLDGRCRKTGRVEGQVWNQGKAETLQRQRRQAHVVTGVRLPGVCEVSPCEVTRESLGLDAGGARRQTNRMSCYNITCAGWKLNCQEAE